MSKFIHKSHNVTVLFYHLVFPAKYRRVVLDAGVDKTIASVCLEIEKRYEIRFLEIGSDDDHIHFLVQSVPMYNITKLVTMIKNISAREVFKNTESAYMLKSNCGEVSFGRMGILQVQLANMVMSQ